MERKLEREGTSVAPPERPVRPPTATLLPPPPQISTERVHVGGEPKITGKKVNPQNSDEDSASVSENESSPTTNKPPVRFGPPKGKPKTQPPHKKGDVNSDSGKFLQTG